MRGVSVLVFLFAVGAAAQREFIEEVGDAPGGKKGASDDVDLDAPDVEDDKPVKKDPPPAVKGTPKAGDPKAGDPKAGDPKAKDPKAGSTDPKATAKAGDPPVDVDVEQGFEILPTTRAAFLEKVLPRSLAVKKGETARARKTLADVETAELEFGMAGVTGGFGSRALGLSLAREAELAVVDGRLEDVTELMEAAERAAPDDLATASQLAHARFAAGDLVGTLTSVGDLVSATRGDPVAVGSVVARVAAVAGVVVLALLMLLALVVALPALRLLAFEVLVSLPRGTHIVQAWALVLLAAVAPVVAGAGLVLSLCWIVTLGILYMPPRARVVAVVVGVLTATLPFIADIFGRGQAAASGDAAQTALALYDLDGHEALDDLRLREAAKEELTLHQRAALALAARREGRVAEALERWRPLVQQHADLGWVHGGYGAALAVAGQDDLALAELGLAIERSDLASAPLPRVVSAFDASLLHHKAGRIDKAQQLIGPAAEANASVVSELRRATYRAPDEVVGHNRAYVDVLPPRSDLVSAALAPSAASAAIAEGLGRPLWHGLPGTTASGVFAVIAFVWLVLTLAARKLPVASACVRCGSAASRRVDGPDVPEGTCAACFHVFLSTKSRVDATVKLRKERAIFLRGRRRARLVTGLSVFPGAGHLFAGAAGRGAALATGFAVVGVAAVAVVDAVVPGVRPLSPWSDLAIGAPLALVAVVIFVMGLRSALVVADEERAGGRR